MKTKILVAALAAGMVAAPSAQAAVEISGQVNVAALFGGAADDLTVVDNNTTGTRFRFKANTKFGNGFAVGTRFEIQAQFAQSNDPDQIGENGGGSDVNPGSVGELVNPDSLGPNGEVLFTSLTDNIDNGGNTPVREVRYADVWISGPFGRVGIGRGDGAANGTAEAVGLLNFLGGNESHLLFNGLGADFNDIDGLSRQNRVRYDSPSWDGFRFAISLDNEDEQEVGLFYDKKGSFGKIRVRAGYTTGEGDASTADFSIAYKFPFGLGLNYSTGEADAVSGVTTSENDWFLVSYDITKKFLISAGYGEETERSASTGAQEGGENDLIILSAVWKPVKGAEIYLNYGDWTNNVVINDADDDNTFALGGRFKF